MTDPRRGDDRSRPALLGPVTFPMTGGAHAVEISAGTICAVHAIDGIPEWLLLPAFVNMHAHAERSFAPAPPPQSFADAVRRAAEIRKASAEPDFQRRAEILFARALAQGTGKLRTHTDVDDLVEDRALRGVLSARAAFAGRLTIEIAAFANSRVDPTSQGGRQRILGALSQGADLIGASPNAAPDPQKAMLAVLDLARSEGVAADFHLDEHGDAASSLLPLVPSAIAARGLEGQVTISHACAIAALPPNEALEIARRLAAVDAMVVALPATNLYLQDRSQATPRRRGITLVRELLAAGVRVRLGSDNVRDSFYPYGDADPLEDAFLLALAAHVDDPAHLVGALCDGRGDPAVGDPADLVLIRADSLTDALARRPRERIVLRGGRVLEERLR